MCDALDALRDTFHTAFEDGDPPTNTPRPTMPLPDHPRTLRRTISYASIETVRPPSRKGIRRRIEDIAENLKQKSTKKKKKNSPAQHVLKNAARDVTSNSNTPAESKIASQEQSATPPLRSSPHRSDEKSVLSTARKMHSSVPLNCELDPLLTFTGCESDSLDRVSPVEEKEEGWEDYFLLEKPKPAAHVTAEPKCTFQSPRIGMKDVQLDIRASETDVTIWDGLQTPHHIFKCRLFLQCTAHPYDSVSLPDIRRVELDCNTHPAGSHYTRPPIIQAAYLGAAPDPAINPDELPKVNPKAGIYMDRLWLRIRDDDGTWGWCRDAFVPLSSRLFDKMEYREFKLVSRVWVGEGCVENELTFGISMLLRELDMK